MGLLKLNCLSSETGMPKNLKRYYGRKHLHFITCSCYRRLPLLRSVRARNVLVKILDEVRRKYGFDLVGYVVMPEHIHLLISEAEKGTPSTVMQVLKQRVSRRLRHTPGQKKSKAPPLPAAKMGHPPQSLPLQLQLRFGRESDAEPRRFWQRRFHDFNVWSAKKKNEKLEYMHLNPVKRKLVSRPQDWLWSSHAAYARRGITLIPIAFKS